MAKVIFFIYIVVCQIKLLYKRFCFFGDGTAQLVPVDVPLSFHPRGSGGTRT